MVKSRGVILFLLLTGLAPVTILSCLTSSQLIPPQNDLQEFVNTNLGSETQINFNETKALALCYQKRQGDHIHKVFRYIVVNVKDCHIILEGNFSGGYVKWISDDSIELVSRSTQNNMDEPIKKIIRVESNQR